ncbi:hypothetical protein GCM10009839_38800 [Catenulispora yoronensis]|uniref:Uncharacterized protein n=1 Tax=Catenulispora yoronensis TaxID=450799 RepID=A0ABN2UCF9_9ACTN
MSMPDADSAPQQSAVMPRRLLARDAQGRVGEVMPSAIPEHLRGPYASRRVHLRPEGGGREWSVPASEVEYLERES